MDFSTKPRCGKVERVSSVGKESGSLDCIILAAGFEDRAFEVIRLGDFRDDAHCILIRFQNDIPQNDKVFDRFLETAKSKFQSKNIHIADLPHSDPGKLEENLKRVLLKLPREVQEIGVDISGQPAYAVCMTLNALRTLRPSQRQMVFYTAAQEYRPTKDEYEELLDGTEEIELLPRSMALEMSDNLSLDSFSGYRSQSARSCLAIFAGYEAHRSTGVIEAVNPSLLVLMYGSPGDKALSWRLKLSKRLHRKFETGRRTASEVVSTLQIDESLRVLEEYYHFLIDDYDLTIAPIGSKMQSLAAYLFWEQYGEIRLTFPLPIGYDPELSPKGASAVYKVVLEARTPLFAPA